MWPFRRSRTDTTDQAIDDAIGWASLRWTAFHATGGVPANLSLRDQIAYFAAPLRSDLPRAFPRLAGANDQILLLIIAKAIQHSGTHERGQIERQLGILLPP